MTVVPSSRRALYVALAVVVLAVAGVTAFWLNRRGGADDQCAKPVAERTTGWVCPGPADGGSEPGGY